MPGCRLCDVSEKFVRISEEDSERLAGRRDRNETEGNFFMSFQLTTVTRRNWQLFCQNVQLQRKKCDRASFSSSFQGNLNKITWG